MEHPTTTYYNAKDIPAETLEEIIKGIHDRGFGAAGPAMSSSDLYCWIAKVWALRKNQRWPHLARLECTYEKRNSMSVYSVAHCQPVDEILKKYFKLYSTSNEDYWYKSSTTLKSVNHWLGDDYRGTMENPY